MVHLVTWHTATQWTSSRHPDCGPTRSHMSQHVARVCFLPIADVLDPNVCSSAVCPPAGHLSLAMAAVSRLKPGGLLHCAPVCSSWVWISRGSSGRTWYQPLGDTSRKFVKDGNCMAARPGRPAANSCGVGVSAHGIAACSCAGSLFCSSLLLEASFGFVAGACPRSLRMH